MSTRSLLKSLIVVYSEAIWIYFGLALYAKIEWDITQLPLPYAWISACFLGYAGQFLLTRWVRNTKLKYLFTLVPLFILITFNWHWFSAYDRGYGLAFLLTCVFLYLRSAYYFLKEPTRAQMLLRFEGNVLWYILFVLILKVHPNLETLIHIPFMVGILFSLAGMTLTLHPESGQKEAIKTKMVGNSWGLLGVVIVVLALGSLLSLLLLVNQVRTGVVTIVFGTWEGVGALGDLVLKAMIWLLSLTSPPEANSELLQQSVPPSLSVTEAEAVAYIEMPLFWLFLSIAVLAIFAILYFLPKIVPKMASNQRVEVEILSGGPRKSFWLLLWQRIKSMLESYIFRWRRNFPGFYLFRVYWDFYLLQKWCGKLGFSRLPHETPLDYGQRLINEYQLPEDFNYKGENYNLRHSVLELVQYYGFVYYGGERVGEERDFEPLMEYLGGKR